MKNEKKKTMIGRALYFVQGGLWTVRANNLSWIQRISVYALRVVSLVKSSFHQNQCSLHAASLTFFSLMALIPVLVLVLALARTFGGADLAKAQIDRQLNTWMAQMEQSVEARTPTEGEDARNAKAEVTQAFSGQVREISDKLYSQVNSISFGTLGGIGLVMLLWTVIGVLGKVESSFNQVWGIEKPRPLARKFTDYLSVILILPFLILAISTVPVASAVHKVMAQAVGTSAALEVRSILDSGLLKMGIAGVVGTLTFAFFLGFMPNMRMKTSSALVGGFVTLLLFGGWLKLCAMLQVGIGKYSALYGGFAVLPILLMWVYTSWQIILLGSVISFVVQNLDTCMQVRYAQGASMRSRLLLALALCAETARLAREKEGGPFAVQAFIQQRALPYRFVEEVLSDLVRNQVLAEVVGRPGEYLLYRCASSMTVAEIANMLLNDGESPETLGLGNLDESVLSFGKKIDAALEGALAIPMAKV